MTHRVGEDRICPHGREVVVRSPRPFWTDRRKEEVSSRVGPEQSSPTTEQAPDDGCGQMQLLTPPWFQEKHRYKGRW